MSRGSPGSRIWRLPSQQVSPRNPLRMRDFFWSRPIPYLGVVPQLRRSHFPGYFRCLADPLSRASSLRCDPGQCRSSLQLRHDHGSQYLSADFQNEISVLGVRSSPVFVRVPEGNGCLQRAIRNVKERLLWLTTFETAQELGFVYWHGPSGTTSAGSSACPVKDTSSSR
jgi:transposase InsO family protein